MRVWSWAGAEEIAASTCQSKHTMQNIILPSSFSATVVSMTHPPVNRSANYLPCCKPEMERLLTPPSPLCFFSQPIPHHPIPHTSPSPCSAAGFLTLPRSPPVSPSCHPLSHQLTSPSIFPSFSSPHLFYFTSTDPIFSSSFARPLLFWSSLNHLSGVTPICSFSPPLSFSSYCPLHPSILL